MVFSYLRKLSKWILLFLLMLAVGFFLVNISNLKFINSEEFNSSISSFISIEGSDEYVIATLKSTETFEMREFKNLFGWPFGDTHASISVEANYKYFVPLSGIVHRLVDDTLYIEAPDLQVSLPVAFDIRSLSERAERRWFGPRKDVLVRKLRLKMSKQLRLKGNLHKSSVYDAGAEAIAENFNKYLEKNGLSGTYSQIVVSFNGVDSEVKRVFEYEDENCEGALCTINMNVGGYHIFSSSKKSVDRK